MCDSVGLATATAMLIVEALSDPACGGRDPWLGGVWCMLRPLNHLRAGGRLLARSGHLVHLPACCPGADTACPAGAGVCSSVGLRARVSHTVCGLDYSGWTFHTPHRVMFVCSLIAVATCVLWTAGVYSDALGNCSRPLLLPLNSTVGADLWEEHVRGRAFGTVLLVGSLGAHPAHPVQAGKGARRGPVMPEQGLLVWCM